MKRIAMLLLSAVVILAGCESDSKSSKNDLRPVLDANGRAVANDAGEPLLTDSNGNTGPRPNQP